MSECEHGGQFWSACSACYADLQKRLSEKDALLQKAREALEALPVLHDDILPCKTLMACVVCGRCTCGAEERRKEFLSLPEMGCEVPALQVILAEKIARKIEALRRAGGDHD